MAVEGLQAGGRQGAGGVAVHGKVHVENELDLRVHGGAGGVVLDAAGSVVAFGLLK